jgi:mannitol-specific phosphotransferase system IIBC component
MNDLKLYQLSEDFKAMMDVIAASEGELEESYEYYMEQLYSAIKDKSDKCVFYHQYLTDAIEAIDKRRKELANAVQSLKNKKENFEKYIVECMARMGASKLEGSTTRIAIRKPSMMIEVYDMNLLSDEFKKKEIVITPKKKEIKDAIDKGVHVEGAKKVYSKKPSVSFKVKA